MFGLLNIDKPRGHSSRWVVDQVQRLVRPAKVGHAGTLDPLATGVLVLCLGRATRLTGYVQKMRKWYRATFQLGRTSTTEDIDGVITELENPPQPTLAEIEAAAARFIGDILQRPPQVSAIKVEGRRAYDMARAGEQFELPERTVSIYSIEVLHYEYPELSLDIHCSGGTYIRSLGRDLGEALGSGAIMTALERRSIGDFRIEEAVDVTRLNATNLSVHLISPLAALPGLPRVRLAPGEVGKVVRGQSVMPAAISVDAETSNEFAALDDRGQLIAVLQRRPDGSFGPSLNFGSGRRS